MGWDKHYGFQLYQSDPSGNYGGWKATCIGNNSAVSLKTQSASKTMSYTYSTVTTYILSSAFIQFFSPHLLNYMYNTYNSYKAARGQCCIYQDCGPFVLNIEVVNGAFCFGLCTSQWDTHKALWVKETCVIVM